MGVVTLGSRTMKAFTNLIWRSSSSVEVMLSLNSEIRFDRQAFWLVVEIRWRQQNPTSAKLGIAKRRCCRAKDFWFANHPSFVTDEQPTAVRRGPEWLRK